MAAAPLEAEESAAVAGVAAAATVAAKEEEEEEVEVVMVLSSPSVPRSAPSVTATRSLTTSTMAPPAATAAGLSSGKYFETQMKIFNRPFALMSLLCAPFCPLCPNGVFSK
jgi:hypothetical protein